MSNLIEKENQYLTTEQENEIYNLIQQSYNKATMVENNIQRTFTNNFIITKESILDLHSMLTYIRDKYDSKLSHSDSITIFTLNGKTATSSIEEFKHLHYNDHDLTTRIRIEYNFLLSPKPKNNSLLNNNKIIDNLEHYKINIMFHSRLGLLHAENSNISSNSGAKIRRFLSLNRSTSAEIYIEFSDRIVAETILDNFTKWTNKCEQNNNNMFMKQCQKHAPTIIRALDICLIVFFIYFMYNKINDINMLNNLDLLKYSIYVFLGFYMFTIAYKPLLGKLGFFLDTSLPSMYIEISESDKNKIKSILQRSKNIKRYFCSVVSSLILPIITGVIINYLGNLMK